jgi:hypothetical protein
MADMTTFQCIYSGKQLPASEKGSEPIIPYELGGSDELSLQDVSQQASADIQKRVVSPFVNSLPVSVDRLMNQVRDRQGNLASLLFKGSIDVDGQTLPARYQFTEEGNTLLVSPEAGGEPLRVACTAEQFLELVAQLEGKLTRRTSPVELEKALQALVGPSIARPVISSVEPIDWKHYPREMVRMALAFGHECLGSGFSASDDAKPLRDFIQEDDAKKRATIPVAGSSWPPLSPDSDRIRGAFLVPDHHLLAVTNANHLIFYGVLFGRYSASVLLSNRSAEFASRVPQEDGLLVLVNYKTREVKRMKYKEFATAKLMGLF